MTNNTPSNMAVQPGDMAIIHSLQSEGGKKLNGKDALVIRKITDDQGQPRFQCKIRGNKPVNTTTAVKPENLRIKGYLPLPTEGGRPRGYVEDTPANEDRCPILCELLVMETEEYNAPKTKLTGFPAMAFSELGQYNFTGFTAMQMEWVAACYALGDIIKKGGASAVENVVFALMEGDPMYIDVLIVTLTGTPFIGSEMETKEKILLFHEFKDSRHQLTPDQEGEMYIKFLKIGPLRILHEASKYKFGAALFAAMKKSPVFHLLVQRLLKFIGRESTGTPDGVELGPICRDLVPKLCDGMMPEALKEMFKTTLDTEQGLKLLDHTTEFTSLEEIPGAFKTCLGAMSHGQQVSKYLSMLNRRRK